MHSLPTERSALRIEPSLLRSLTVRINDRASIGDRFADLSTVLPFLTTQGSGFLARVLQRLPWSSPRGRSRATGDLRFLDLTFLYSRTRIHHPSTIPYPLPRPLGQFVPLSALPWGGRLMRAPISEFTDLSTRKRHAHIGEPRARACVKCTTAHHLSTTDLSSVRELELTHLRLRKPSADRSHRRRRRGWYCRHRALPPRLGQVDDEDDRTSRCRHVNARVPCRETGEGETKGKSPSSTDVRSVLPRWPSTTVRRYNGLG